jgi:hypothetical protein
LTVQCSLDSHLPLQALQQLDAVRKRPQKFVCLNDNIDHRKKSASEVFALFEMEMLMRVVKPTGLLHCSLVYGIDRSGDSRLSSSDVSQPFAGKINSSPSLLASVTKWLAV